MLAQRMVYPKFGNGSFEFGCIQRLFCCPLYVASNVKSCGLFQGVILAPAWTE